MFPELISNYTWIFTGWFFFIWHSDCSWVNYFLSKTMARKVATNMVGNAGRPPGPLFKWREFSVRLAPLGPATPTVQTRCHPANMVGEIFVIRSLRYSSNSIVTLVKWVKCRFMGGERVNLVLPPASCEPGLIFLADSTSISSVVVIYGWSTSAGPLFFKARCSKHHSPDYSSIYASVITTPLKFCSQLLVLVLKTWTKPNSTSRILKTEKLCKNKLQKSDADFFYKIRKEGRWCKKDKMIILIFFRKYQQQTENGANEGWRRCK